MSACAPVLPQTGGPGPTQTTPMTHISWADLEEPQVFHLSFYFVRSVPKTQSPPQWDLELAPGPNFLRNLHYF